MFTTPRQCGPTSRIPLARQIASSSARSSSSGPSSSTTSARTSPRAAHARAAADHVARGQREHGQLHGALHGGDRAGGRGAPARLAGGQDGVQRAGVAAARLASTAAPTVPGAAVAAATSTDAGRRTCPTAATAASRSRASKRRRPSAVGDVGKRTCSSPGPGATSTGKPEARNTPIIRWLPAIVIAANTPIPSAAAESARWASSVVASPRPSHVASIANATSASSASMRTYIAWPTTRSGAPVSTSSAARRAARRSPARRGRG